MSQRTLWDWKERHPDAANAGTRARRTLGVLEFSEEFRSDSRDLGRAHQLHWQLECHLGPVDLILTDNRRRMLTAKRERGRHRLRVHHMFLGCDPETVAAIVALAQGDEEARGRIERYIRCNRDQISFRPDDDEIERVGEHFDLSEMLDDVRGLLSTEHREHVEDVEISWGRDGRGSKSIRFGSYDFDQRLIRVHPALDQAWVPRYFVAFIVYHELLHPICPPRQSGERRNVHTQKFDELERQFPRYEEAIEWESENLSRILNRDG